MANNRSCGLKDARAEHGAGWCVTALPLHREVTCGCSSSGCLSRLVPWQELYIEVSVPGETAMLSSGIQPWQS
ncbi:hypothetical protein Nmel_016220 [Mimus melanotis]